MNFFKWVSKSAPWLQPVIALALLVFAVVGPWPKLAYQDALGPGLIGSLEAARAEAKAAGRELPPPAVNLDDAQTEFVWALIGAVSADWRRIILTVLLVGLVGLSVLVRQRSERQSRAASPAAQTPPEAVGSWTHPIRLTRLLVALLLFAQLAVILALLPRYYAPKSLQGLGNGLSCRQELSTGLPLGWGDEQVQLLYSWVHGVDPSQGRTSQYPDLDQFGNLSAYYDSLSWTACWTLLTLVALFTFAGTPARGGSGRIWGMTVQLLLVVMMVLHTFQWIWLIESFGRVQLAGRALQAGAQTYLERMEAAEADGEKMEQARLSEQWPFMRPFFDPPSAALTEEALDVQLRNLWPYTYARPLFVSFGRGQPRLLTTVEEPPCEGGVSTVRLDPGEELSSAVATGSAHLWLTLQDHESAAAFSQPLLLTVAQPETPTQGEE